MGSERLPWWLTGGEERCRICLQRYAVQVEVRCVDCDRGTCPFCTALVEGSRERWCVDCVPAGVVAERA